MIAILKPFSFHSVKQEDIHEQSNDNYIGNRKIKWVPRHLQMSHIQYRKYFGDLFDGLVFKKKGWNERKTLKKTGIWFATHNRREEDEGEWVDKEWVLKNFGNNFVSSCNNHPGHWLHVPVGRCRVHNQEWA